MADHDTALAAVRLAGAHYRAQGHRLDAARSGLGLGSTAFYATVNRAIDDPAVMLVEPLLCARLRRLRAQGLSQRGDVRRLPA